MSFYCKNCGTELENVDGQKIAVCDFCGMEQTLPTADDPKKLELFAKANEYRMASRFDVAKKQYESIIAQYPDDNEAYWCKLLCEYGIEYVDDALTEKKLPTCHRTVTESIFDNKEYKLIMSRASAEEKAIYESEAKEIDRIQKEILASAQEQEPYDIFICYKESENDSKKRTVDAQHATKIYTYLTEHGYKVFFSRITLKGKLGSEYEPVIYSALKSAKVMLHVTTSTEHTNAPWVRNEWSRFLEFMNADVTKTILPCIAQMGPYELPEELSKFQVADMTDLDFLENLARQIDSKFGREEQSQSQPSGNDSESGRNARIQNLIKQARESLCRQDWQTAKEFTESCLNVNFKYAEAYVIKLMCDFKIDVLEKIVQYSAFIDNINYKQALQFADAELKKKLINIEKQYYYEKAKSFGNNLLSSEIYNKIKECLEKARGYLDADDLLISLPKRKKEQQKKLGKGIFIASIMSAIVAVIVVAIITIVSINDYNARNGLKMQLQGDYYVVTGIDGNAKSSYKIPSTYQGKPVKAIGESTFKGCSNLVSVEIPDSITSIGESTFEECSNLITIKIPDSLRSIGDYAFYNCVSLTNVKIGESLTNIGDFSFYNCDRLTNVKIPESVTSIGYSAFEGCSSITSITIPFVGATKNETENTHFGYIFGASSYSDNEEYVPESLKTVIIGGVSVGDYSFYNCDTLTSIVIGDSVTGIGNYAFANCYSLLSVVISDSVTNISNHAFFSCYNLIINCKATSKPSGWNKSWNGSNRPVVWGCKNNDVADDGYIYGKITVDGISYATKANEIKITGTNISGAIVIPSSIMYNSQTYSITSIGDSAFRNCRGITSIEIPDSITSIGEYAFSGCDSLTSIEIPDSITSIGMSAFSNCSSLTSITIPFVGETKNGIKNTHFGYIFGALSYSNNEESVPTSLKTLEITGGAGVDDNAFYKCNSLTSVVIGNSVTSIGEGAFRSCYSLTSIKIPDTVTSIGNVALAYCDSLTSIEISDSVTSIGRSAFYCCPNLTIYCKAESQPVGWSSYWNPSNRPVVWGYKGE